MDSPESIGRQRWQLLMDLFSEVTYEVVAPLQKAMRRPGWPANPTSGSTRSYGATTAPRRERLTLPGLARTLAPRSHQRAAVARILSEPAVGLFHQVGVGKTAEMMCGAMELRRLSSASRGWLFPTTC